MSFRKQFRFAAIAIAVLALAQLAHAQTTGDGKIANMTVGSSSVRWDMLVPNSGGAVTIAFPDGRSVRKAFRAGGSAEFDLTDKQLDGLSDGVYNYELKLAPALTAGQKETLMKARGNDDDSETERNLRKRPAVPSMSQSGTFAIANGVLVGPGLVEGTRDAAASQPAKSPNTVQAAQQSAATRVSANTITRLRNHRFSLAPAAMFDFVIADDLIVQGSTCSGLDCVDGEVFNFDTLRLKENNTRIGFMDTSVGTFPSEDWTIRANSSANGGGNFLAFVDQGTTSTGAETGTIVFEVDAGAPANSLRVSSGGKIGIRTGTPVLDVHVNTSDTPAFRMEQNNSGGFTAQTWDIGGNEANWFVRDVTGGSRLPLRIRPGAPTSSIDISASGNVGIGTASPGTKLNIAATSDQTFRIDNTTSTFMALMRVQGSAAQFGASNASTLQLVVDNTPRVTVLPTSGNVGIATTAPDQLLSVNGDADKVGGGSWLNFSDERLKTIKGQFNSGLKAVMQLTPIRYEYLKNNALGLKSEGDHIGFGAQTLQKVIPEAVTQNSSGYLMVNNDPVMWTMLNAIKEQQKEIEQLRQQVRRLQRSPRKTRR